MTPASSDPATTRPPRSSSSTSRTTSPIPAGRSPCRRRAVVPVVNAQVAAAPGGRRARRLHPGLASRRTRRTSPRTAASGRSTASGHVGRRVPPGARGRRPVVRKGTNGEDGYSGFTMRDPISGARSRPSWRRCSRRPASSGSWSCGLATDYCVKATALDAVAAGLCDGGADRRDPGGRPGPGDGHARSRSSAAAGVELLGATTVAARGRAVVRLLALAAAGTGLAWAVDRWLGGRRGRTTASRSSIRSGAASRSARRSSRSGSGSPRSSASPSGCTT